MILVAHCLEFKYRHFLGRRRRGERGLPVQTMVEYYEKRGMKMNRRTIQKACMWMTIAGHLCVKQKEYMRYFYFKEKYYKVWQKFLIEHKFTSKDLSKAIRETSHRDYMKGGIFRK